MHASVTCGWCGSGDTDAEFVNNGVGMQQVTAASCNHCGAIQMSPEDWGDLVSGVDPEDLRRGWYASAETEDVVIQDLRASEIRARDFKNGEKMLVEHEGTVHQAFKRLSWADPTFQMLCGIETEVAKRPSVEAVTCFECITYWAKGRP
jgi:hypothetical protein